LRRPFEVHGVVIYLSRCQRWTCWNCRRVSQRCAEYRARAKTHVMEDTDVFEREIDVLCSRGHKT